MIVTPVEHGLEDLLAKSGPRSTDKLHMSDIYGALYKELEPERYGGEGAPDPLRLEAGLALESMLETGLRDRLCGGGRPGELVTEHDIHYNPDLVIFNGCTRVGEIKLTWMSCRGWPETATNGLPPKANKYVTQMKLYCRALDTPYARLIAYFVNGDYDRSRAFGPQLRAWDIEFSRRELEEEWQTCMSFARQRGMIR